MVRARGRVASVDLMTTEEVAELLTLSAGAVRAWRNRGGGPPYLKIGTRVRYDRAEVLEWIDAQRVTDW